MSRDIDQMLRLPSAAAAAIARARAAASPETNVRSVEISATLIGHAPRFLESEAQHFLGMYYAGGYGVPKSKTAAAYWYRKAIAQGHEDARKQYALLFGNAR